MTTPAGAHPDPVRVCFVCSGNICRSPMAEVVLRRLVADAGLAGRIEIDSAGTGDWHVGEPADPRTLVALRAAGYAADHRARQFDPAWFADRELIIALDRGHLATLRALAPSPADAAKVRLLREFDPDRPAAAGLPDGVSGDVPDPYYGDERDFADVLALIERSCAGLLAHLTERLVTAGS